MVDTQSAPSLGKRKRHDEGHKIRYVSATALNVRNNTNMMDRSGHSTPHRQSPGSKGLLKLHEHAHAFDNNSSRMYPVSAATYMASDRRATKQLRRTIPKVTLVKTGSHLMDVDFDPAPSIHTNSDSDLRPCHACKTAPKRKRDLENYMDCRRCVERACYICARICMGCEKAICKKCIVEVGEEGDSWCLDCYSNNINS
jgi:hypothetical protein